VAAGRVWTIGASGVLYGLDPGTGQVRQQASIGGLANHFPTPSVGAGLLLAPSASHVVAFAAVTGTAAPPPSPATSPASRPASQPGPDDSGGLPAGAIAGLTVAGAAVLAGIGWLARRRRPSRPRSR
jgi:outer membrane protein assembly factor BamB